MALRISVLDQSPISEGSTPAEALQNSMDLARLADRLGFHRYWVAEHHGTPMLACAAPEVLIAAIASVTERIHVGSGGVMLPHYSPLKVAESFSMLSGLFPGRIDLGLGRAFGTDGMTALALQRDRRQSAPDDFPNQLAELIAYLNDTLPADHPFAKLAKFLPGIPQTPELWLLGSSPQSGIWAAQLGIPYAFADFINREGAAIAQRYIADFDASGELPAPRVAVASSAICAETDAEAQRIAASARMVFHLFQQGQLMQVPSIETAEQFFADRSLSPEALPRRRRAIIGSPLSVRRGIEAVAEEYGAEEVIIVTITYSHEHRRRSYELIAEAFGLSQRQEEPQRAAG